MDRIVGGSPAHQNVPATLTGVGECHPLRRDSRFATWHLWGQHAVQLTRCNRP